MREILFRGKMISGQWVYGDLRQYQNGNTAIRSNDYTSMMAVSSETVGQYTGLTDKNGMKIFEGDEVQAFLPATVVQREFAWPVMQVVFSRGAFGLIDSRGEVTPFRSFSPRVEFEVVGNVFDDVEGER
jgi:uncharacterized phage protein (TIGR01671 family)